MRARHALLVGGSTGHELVVSGFADKEYHVAPGGNAGGFMRAGMEQVDENRSSCVASRFVMAGMKAIAAVRSDVYPLGGKGGRGREVEGGGGGEAITCG